MKRIKLLKAGAVAFFMLAFLFFPFAVQAADAGQENSTASAGQISVTGEGVVELKPDTVEIILGVQNDGLTAVDAQKANAVAMTEITSTLNALLKDGERWETVQISLYPVNDWSEEGKGKVVGFRAENRIRIILSDISSAPKIIDSCVEKGANIIESINFTSKSQSQAMLDAIKLAVKDAYIKAEAALAAAGKEIKEIKSITVNDSYYVPLQKNLMLEGAGGIGESTPLEAGLLEVRATVAIVYTF